MTAPAEETPADGAESPADVQTDPAEGDSTEGPADAPKGNREAKYRTERNAARTALTEAQSTIAALQLREVIRLAGEHLADPADLLGLGGVELADLVGDDGAVSPEAVAEVAASVTATRPGLALRPVVRATDTSQGTGGTRPGKAPAGWDALFQR
jgi:hypothetical protein